MSPKCGRQVPEQPDGPSVSLPSQVQQRLRSTLSDHDAVGVDADPTASWQGVQCEGLRFTQVRGVPRAGGLEAEDMGASRRCTPVLSHDAGHERDDLIVDAEIAVGRPGPPGL